MSENCIDRIATRYTTAVVSISGVPGIALSATPLCRCTLRSPHDARRRCERAGWLYSGFIVLGYVMFGRVRMVQAPQRSARGARVAGRERRDISKRAAAAARTESTLPRTHTCESRLPHLSRPSRPPVFAIRNCSRIGLFCFCAPPMFLTSYIIFSTSGIGDLIPREVEKIIVL